MKRMTMIVFCAALVLAGAATGLRAAPGDGLDGSNWKMRAKNVAGIVMFWKYDHLAFKDGNFISIDCRQAGFAPAAYAATKSGEGAAWTAALTNANGEKVVWEGRREGARMNGTYTWTKADGTAKVVSWGAKQVMHEHPEHPTSKKESGAAPAPAAAPTGKEHPEGKEHTSGMEHPAPAAPNQ